MPGDSTPVPRTASRSPPGRCCRRSGIQSTGDFDQFGFAVAASPTGLLVGARPDPPVSTSSGYRAASAVTHRQLHAAWDGRAGGSCGNGLVEGTEDVDDGTASKRRLTGRTAEPICCTLDPLATERCDDGNPCTDDILDAQRGCTHRAHDRCCTADGECVGGKCRVCVGCFLYPWDCCETGSVCLARTDECSGTECLAAALCACAGGLSCNGEGSLMMNSS